MALNGVEREGVCSFTLLVINYDGSKIASSALLTTRYLQIKSISGSSFRFAFKNKVVQLWGFSVTRFDFTGA